MKEKDIICNGIITCDKGSQSIPIKCECMVSGVVATISMNIGDVSITIDAAPVINFFVSAMKGEHT